MKQTLRRFAIVAVALFASAAMFAQVTTSSMSGKIIDAQGSVPGAVIIATYTPNGTQYHAVSDANGNYRILNITPGGPYTVEVDLLGYAINKTTGISVALADNYVHNVTLQEETLSLSEVVIAADSRTSNMRSDRAGALTAVSSKQISAMPTVSRSMNDVMRLSPHAAYTSNGIAIGGGNYRSSYVTVDGASFNNSFGIGSNLPAGGSPISLDALEQMAISITPYDVRQSGFTGGAIQTTTKSGSNEFHVSVYDYYKSDALIGTKYGDEDKKLTLSESLNNTTGINISGPIVKNKLFYFVNFEYDMDVVPGVTRLARTSESQEWGGSTQYNRPTVAFMDEVKQYLLEKYNYDPGRYADYSASTPDWKVLARVDWLINSNNKLTARFSKTKNKYSSSPSSSVSGLTTISGYSSTRNSTGRISNNALYFESNRYFQEQNYTTFAAELNSRLMDGNGNNILRVTYSKQYEPRSYVGDLFPTVDIFDGEGSTAVMTSFGLDPFTYGNLRDVASVNATDEFTYSLGRNLITVGLGYEYNKAINGYMQGGAGYYSFASWEDFKAGKANAFSIMYGNNAEMEQAYPSISNHQISAYLQDEINVSDRFKLTAGIRFDMPIYPDMSFNENKAFTAIYASATDQYKGIKTSDIPAAALNISPRLGFNWDVTGDRKVVVRGGTGIFTGRLPMVWLVSAVGNSNVLQNKWGTTNASQIPEFKTKPDEIIAAMKAKNPDITLVGDLAAPSGATILAKDLKMPQTWKSSLAVDVMLPWGIKASVEGIYNKDLRTVYANNILYKADGTVQLPGEPEARTKYSKVSGRSATYYLGNTEGVNGYYSSIAATLSKNFSNGLSASVSYTHNSGMSVNEGIGDQVSSSWNTNTYAVNGSNSPELGYGSYVAPNRVVANISYRIPEGKNFATTLGLFYEGYNYGYANGQSYSYTRYSYLMKDQTGLGGAANLIYIPTDSELSNMPFSDESNKAEFKKFIESEKYLASHRGEYSVRGAGVMPWHSALNFKVAQELGVKIGSRTHSLVIGLDINNVGNMLNPAWGNAKYLSTETILAYSDGVYKFTKPEWYTVGSTASTWSALLSVKYLF